MLVRIGNKLYDAQKVPVMLVLSTQDRNNIKNTLLPEASRFYEGPSLEDSSEIHGVHAWMDGEGLSEEDQKVLDEAIAAHNKEFEHILKDP